MRGSHTGADRNAARAVVAAILLALALAGASPHAQQAGLNTPVLPGLPDNPAHPHALLISDLLQQRQLEPEIVVSTRNPLHLLAVFNDYRAVDINNDPTIGGSQFARHGVFERFLAWVRGKPTPKTERKGERMLAASEATTGMARSYDGGLTWTGGLLPGSLDDPSPAAASSPIYGLEAMTDPRAVAAPCGRAYVVNVAFTRGGASKLLVTRFEDRNSTDGGENWHMLGQTVIEQGRNSPGHFHDLPYVVVDEARSPGAAECDHVIYVGWARFSGDELASKIMFARSLDGGITWTQRYIKSTNKTDQGVVMAVDRRPGTPANGGGGTLYVGWRVFATTTNPDAMWVTSSRDFGDTFARPVSLTAAVPLVSYDQPQLPSTMVGPSQFAYRSNAFMTLEAVPHPTDSTRSTVFAAWQERVNTLQCPGPNCGKPMAGGEPRIVVARSTDSGATWVDDLGAPGRRAVDFGDRDVPNSPDLPAPGFGYLPQHRASGPQMMPRFAFAGGRLALAYLEARGPLTVVQGTDGIAAGMSRQVDARLVLLDPVTGGLVGTSQISRYPIKVGADLSDGEGRADVYHVQPGDPAIGDKAYVPSSRGGTTPFFGDFLGISPVATFIRDKVTGRWRWAARREDVPFRGFHVVFPDSRNVALPPGATAEAKAAAYPQYVPPTARGGTACVNAGSRNHDVMHSLVDAGVPVNTLASYKQLGVIARNWPVTVNNVHGGKRFYRATLTTTAPTQVSFTQDSFTDASTPLLTQIDLEIFPNSSITRAVTVSSPTATASATVTVRELEVTCSAGDTTLDNPLCTRAIKAGGETGTVTLNADPTNAANTAATNTETHNPVVTNPVVTNPVVTNPVVTNPVVTNPVVTNPVVTNPVVTNPSLEGETIYSITDTTWQVTDGGSDATGYATQIAIENAAQFEGNYVFHLLIFRKATAAKLEGCATVHLPQDQMISSVPNPVVTNPVVTNPVVTNPVVTNPVVTNATFAAAPAEVPGEENSHDGTLHDDYTDRVFVTLRAYRIAQNPSVVFDPLATPPAIVVTSLTRNTLNGVVEDFFPSAGVGPDLTIDGPLAVSPTTVVPGDQISVSQAMLRNAGNRRASYPGGIQYSFYWSDDTVVEVGGDHHLTTVTDVGSLAPGATVDLSRTLTVPTTLRIDPVPLPPGTYYVTAFGDSRRDVSETDENNNTIASAPLTVVASPSITTTGLRQATAGEAYSFQMTGSGGVGTLHWALGCGMIEDCAAPPSGLTISDTGLLSWASAVAGTYTIAVTVTDSSPLAASAPALHSDTALFTLQVQSTTPSTLSIVWVSQPPDADAGVGFGSLVQVIVLDAAASTPVPGATVAMSLDGNPAGVTLGGTRSVVTDANGYAMFANLPIDRGGVFRLLASASMTGYSPATQTSNTFIVEGWGPEFAAPFGGGHEATRLANGRVLLTRDDSTQAVLFDPSTATFTNTGQMSVVRQDHTATLLTDGRVLIVGGLQPGPTPTVLNSAEIYDPVTGAFEIVDASMAQARYDHRATALADGRVLFTGGRSTVLCCTTVALTELFDPVNASFRAGPPLTDSRHLHTATRLSSGLVLIAGGRRGVGEGFLFLASAELFDPADNTIRAAGDTLNFARTSHTATLLQNGRVLIAGGFGSGGATATAEEFNPVSSVFLVTESGLATARYLHAAELLLNGRLLVSGGWTGGSVPLASVETYVSASGSFVATMSMTSGRVLHQLVRLASGHVLATGGGAGATAQIYYVKAPVVQTFTGTITGGPDGATCQGTGEGTEFANFGGCEFHLQIGPSDGTLTAMLAWVPVVPSVDLVLVARINGEFVEQAAGEPGARSVTVAVRPADQVEIIFVYTWRVGEPTPATDFTIRIEAPNGTSRTRP